jgi:hypothetical protein
VLNHSIKVLGDDFRRIQHMALFIQHVAAKVRDGLSFSVKAGAPSFLCCSLSPARLSPL